MPFFLRTPFTNGASAGRWSLKMTLPTVVAIRRRSTRVVSIRSRFWLSWVSMTSPEYRNSIGVSVDTSPLSRARRTSSVVAKTFFFSGGMTWGFVR